MLVTKRSQLTGIEHTMDVPCTEEQVRKWLAGSYIQDAMPNVPAELREFLMTGITPEEWAGLFGDGDGDGDSDDGDEYTGPHIREFDE